ncbi:MAG: iron-sulfur cluster assembly scaffold protein [Syntrophus sp. (in: bacteria)]|nr:iron-sulfur cluster assembly scaffold protein [Syntrophus sp. (in: bacteria)]
MKYSDKVKELLENPHNAGKIENPDGVGQVGNPVCGDMMTIMIKVRDDRIEDIRFETFGCGAAIAVSSVVTDMAKGKTIDDAMKISNKVVAEELGDLPTNELHCSNLGADALQEAIRDYLDRKEGKVRRRKDMKVELISSHEGTCFCPYCNQELLVKGSSCSNCGKPTLDK